jgi:hypothetical protein
MFSKWNLLLKKYGEKNILDRPLLGGLARQICDFGHAFY